MNGYNFTDRVRKVLAMAREECASLRHEYVDTEHILLAILREGEGVAATIIQNLGVDLDALSEQVRTSAKLGKGEKATGPDLPYSSAAKRVMELSMTEAREVNHNYVGTEHLLLGLLRQEKGVGARMLTDAGITLEKARGETWRILGTVPDRLSSVPTPVTGVAGALPRFPERLRAVIAAAHDVAAKRGSIDITPAHAAIALLEHGEGMANTILDQIGLDRTEALLALDRIAPRGTVAVGPEDILNPTPELATMLRVMAAVPRARAAFTPGTHDLLLSILTLPDLAALFAEWGVSVQTVNDKIRRISG